MALLFPFIRPDELASLLGAKVVGRIDGLNAYRLRFEDELIAIANQGEFDEFDLGEFFSATGTGAGATFKHKNYVQKWLDIIRQISPEVRKIGVLYNPHVGPFGKLYAQAVTEAGAAIRADPALAPLRPALTTSPTAMECEESREILPGCRELPAAAAT